MRQLNGSPTITAHLVVDFDLPATCVDTFLAAKKEDRPRILDELLANSGKLVPERSSYNAEQFAGQIANWLRDQRENELKQLPETASPDNE